MASAARVAWVAISSRPGAPPAVSGVQEVLDGAAEGVHGGALVGDGTVDGLFGCHVSAGAGEAVDAEDEGLGRYSSRSTSRRSSRHRWTRCRHHPTVMQILNGSGVARSRERRDGILMRGLPISTATGYGLRGRPLAGFGLALHPAEVPSSHRRVSKYFPATACVTASGHRPASK